MPPTEPPAPQLQTASFATNSTAPTNPRTTFSTLPTELRQAIIIQSLDAGQWFEDLSANGPSRLFFEIEKEIKEQVARLFAADAFLGEDVEYARKKWLELLGGHLEALEWPDVLNVLRSRCGMKLGA